MPTHKYSHYIKHNYFSTQPGKRGSVLEFLNFITLPRNRMNIQSFVGFFLKFNLCARLWMLSCLIRNKPGYHFTSELSCPKASNWLADSMTKPQWLYCVRPEFNHTRNPITKCPANPHCFWGRRSMGTSVKLRPILFTASLTTLRY